MNVQALREQRASIYASIRQMADKVNAESREFTAEEQAGWKKANADYDALSAQIQQAEGRASIQARADALAAEQSAGAGDPALRNAFGNPNPNARHGQEVTEAHRETALRAWCTAQMGGAISPEDQEACQLVGIHPGQQQLRMRLFNTPQANGLRKKFGQVHPSQAVDHVMDYKATLTIGNPVAGGYLVPPETLIRNLEINMLAYGGMRQVAETIRTSSGERMSWPTADDTSNAGVQLGESTTIGSSVDPSFGKVFWDAYKFSSKAVLVPFELIQDSAFDIPGMLGQMFGERLGRITNTKYTTGTGAATPKGIITCASSFSAATTAIAADDIVGLVHSVDPAYRSGGGFMLHDSILLLLRKLKDGMGQYMWQTGMQMGAPDRLFGYPLTNNQDMDSTVTSGKKSILFGQLSSYKIRTVGEARFYRLQERYRDTDQDGFIMLIREDGNALTSGTARLKVLTH